MRRPPEITVPRKAPAIEQKEDRDTIFEQQSKYILCSIEVLRKLRCPGRETKRNDDGKLVVDGFIKGDPLTLMMVYGALCNHANSQDGHKNEAWPSYQRIATMIGVPKKTVERAIPELINRGLIETIGWRKARGTGHTRIFRIIHAQNLSKQDEEAIASYPQAKTTSLMSPRTPLIHNRTTSNHVVRRHDPSKTPEQNDIMMSTPTATSNHVVGTYELLKPTATLLNGTNALEVLTRWPEMARHYELAIPVPNESDKQTAFELEAAHVPMRDTLKAIETHLTDCVAYGGKPHARLKPIVQSLLVQTSNGR